MNRLVSMLALAILALVVVAASSRALIALAGALTAPIVALGIVVALLRCVWFFTGPR
ncbi:MAG TPA: hypothetical protein VFY36_06135 [Solirubrobacteraceae bacterium]|nr:hypothetical protein [Solirubrobacteraceae bacterium]